MAKTNQPKAISEELKEKLQQIANEHKSTIISFVAPHGVRTSPVTFASASIEDSEIYRLEKIIDEATEKGAIESLHLIIHTPGGEMHASYKIANFLRTKFKKISAWIPYEAASGGTILCCAANELHISDFGNITSFDPQIRYKGQRVAANAFMRSVDFIKDEYGEMTPQEIPSPWQQMADKLDPVIYDEMNTALYTSIICAYRLLKKSGYSSDKAVGLATSLGRNAYTHEFPIFAKEAKDMGFEVKADSKEIMRAYQELVSFRLQSEFSKHIIDSFYPETPKENNGKMDKDKNKDKNENKK